MTGGRPLRFLLLVMGGWTAARVAMLWPEATIPALLARPAQPSRAMIEVAGRYVSVGARVPAAAARVSNVSVAPAVRERMRPVDPPQSSSLRPPPPALVMVAGPALVAKDAPEQEVVAPVAPPIIRVPRSGAVSRLAGSAWAVLREGDAAPFAGGRLGGAQAGLRLTYALSDARRVAIAGRVSTPLQGRGREGAVGLDWRPTRLPVRLIAEQRFALDRDARTGPALFLVAGLDATPVAADFRLEAYAQAGVAAGAFADGALRLTRPVVRVGDARVDLGIGAWGGAQRGATRFDVGPGAAVSLPVADRNVRLTLDYRWRVAGRASPGSGPVLSVGSDF